MSTAPAPAPAHPVLHNLGVLLLKYGPILLQWLISSGILKLPPGGTLPPLPTPGAAVDAPTQAAFDAIDAEVDHAALHSHLASLHSFAAQVHGA